MKSILHSILIHSFLVGYCNSFFWFNKKRVQPTDFDWMLQPLIQSGFAARLKTSQGNYVIADTNELRVSEDSSKDHKSLLWIQSAESDSADKKSNLCHVISLGDETRGPCLIGAETEDKKNPLSVRLIMPCTGTTDSKTDLPSWVLHLSPNNPQSIDLRPIPESLGSLGPSAGGGIIIQPTPSDLRAEAVMASLSQGDRWLAKALSPIRRPPEPDEPVGLWPACLLRLGSLGANLTLRSLRTGDTVACAAGRLVPADACGQASCPATPGARRPAGAARMHALPKPRTFRRGHGGPRRIGAGRASRRRGPPRPRAGEISASGHSGM